MTDQAFLDHLQGVLRGIEDAGLMKRERLISGAQGAHVSLGGQGMLNLCANNYLGLANDPRLIAAAKAAMDSHGYGMASVRFICGTQDLHAPVGGSGWRGFWAWRTPFCSPPALMPMGACSNRCLGEEDAIISDSLNHASIIDGVRLCKARRYPVSKQFRHGRSGGAVAGRRGRMGARFVHGCHGWRVLDGRVSGQLAGHHPAGRGLRGAGDGG